MLRIDKFVVVFFSSIISFFIVSVWNIPIGLMKFDCVHKWNWPYSKTYFLLRALLCTMYITIHHCVVNEWIKVDAIALGPQKNHLNHPYQINLIFLWLYFFVTINQIGWSSTTWFVLHLCNMKQSRNKAIIK